MAAGLEPITRIPDTDTLLGGLFGSTHSSTAYASLSAAVTAIGSTVTDLIISGANFPDGANTTVPATLRLMFVGAGSLNQTHTVTILSDGSLWPARKIFTGSGTVSFIGNRLMERFFAQWWGGLGDGQKVTDAVLTSGSGVVTSAAGLFVAADVGKIAYARKEGATASIALGTIASYQSATQVTLSANASGSATGCSLRWGTDNRGPINAALAAITNRGGGKLFFPKGTYKLSGTLDGTTNSLLTFPLVISTVTPKVSVTIEGETWDLAGVNAVVIDATGVVGSGTQPSIIAPKAFSTITNFFTDLSAIQARITNISFIVTENPSITGLQFHNTTTLDLDRITVSIDAILGNSIPEPMVSTTYGVCLPGVANDVSVYVRSSFITGFYNGILYSEHAKFAGAFIRKCKVALVGETGYHVNTGDVCIDQCGIMLQVLGISRFDFVWEVERNDTDVPAWFAKQTYDIVDASNNAVGSIRYINSISYTSDSGPATTLTRNGAFNVDLNQLDNPTQKQVGVSNSAAISVPHNTETTLTFNTNDIDGQGAHSTSVHPERIYCTQVGNVTLVATVQFAANATGVRGILLYKVVGGTPILIAAQAALGYGPSATSLTVSAIVTNSSTHWFEVHVFQDSGGALNVNAIPFFSPRFTLLITN